MFYLGIDQHAKQLTVNLRDYNLYVHPIVMSRFRRRSALISIHAFS